MRREVVRVIEHARLRGFTRAMISHHHDMEVPLADPLIESGG